MPTSILYVWHFTLLRNFQIAIKIEFFGQCLQQCVLTAARRVWSIVIFLDISLSLIISCLRNATACFELKKRKKNWFDVRQIRSSIIFWIAAAPTWFCKNFYTMTRRKYYGSYVTRSIFEGLKYNQSKLMSRLSGSMDIQYLFQMKIIKKFLLEILP